MLAEASFSLAFLREPIWLSWFGEEIKRALIHKCPYLSSDKKK